MAFIIGNNQNNYKMVVEGSGSGVNMNLGDTALAPSADTAAQTVIKTAGKTASKVIESGGDIITAPAVWLKDIQQNWLMYMIVAAIILASIVFLYCVVSLRFNRKNNNRSFNNIVELAHIFRNKNGAPQQLAPLSTATLPSVSPNLEV